jgi:hypothetical protein
MAGVAGIDYGALVRQVCELGLQRSREMATTAERWALAVRLSGVAPESQEPDLFPAGEA